MSKESEILFTSKVIFENMLRIVLLGVRMKDKNGLRHKKKIIITTKDKLHTELSIKKTRFLTVKNHEIDLERWMMVSINK